MTPQRLASILTSIGAKNISVRPGKVRCSCLLAPWTHSGGSDGTPSMVVFAEGRHGDPIYSCQACHKSGVLRDLVCTLWHLTGINMMNAIEAIDGPDVAIEGVPTETKHPTVLAKLKRLKRLQSEGGAYEARRKKRQSDDPWFDRRSIELSDAVPEIPWEELEPYLTEKPHQYAVSRGIEEETWLEWEMGIDRRMRRILFPMRDHRGRLVAISGRLYEEKKCLRCGGRIITMGGKKKKKVCGNCGKKPPPKYLHNNGFKRNLMLYGEHTFKQRNNKVYLVEGHMDVLKMWQYGFRPTVALLGSNPGDSQIERLIYYASLVIIVADGDKAGEEMIELVKNKVAGRIPVFGHRLPDEMDPGKMSRFELVRMLGDPWGKGVDKQLSIG